MTQPSPEETRRYQLAAVLGELVPEYVDLDSPRLSRQLSQAGRLVAQKHSINHRIMHADAQRAGAIVWAMRDRGMSWRQIYDATGIVQRSGQRWADLFLAEGITTPSAAELDARADGPHEEGESR
jgi:hypothetical protein